MSRHRRRALLLSALIIGTACAPKPTVSDAGPADSGPAKDAGPITPTDAGTTLTGFGSLLVALCQSIVNCQETFTDLTSCEAYLEISGSVDTVNSPGAIQAAISAGTITMNSSLLPACATALANLPCSSTFNGSFNSVPACAGVFTDTAADGGLVTSDGEPCIADEQCPTGSVCFVSASAADQCGALCIPAGSACNTDSDCATGDVCNIASNTCTQADPPPGGNGAACGQDDLCAAGLVCLDEADGGSVCGHPSGNGGPCAMDGTCATGFTCDQNNTCAAPPAKGQPCDGVCASGLICVPSTNLQTSTCMTEATVGQACASLFQCGGLYSLYICDLSSGTCVNRPVTGACPDNAFAYSCDWRTTWCDTTQTPPQCEPFLSVGSACPNDGACGSLGSGYQCSGQSLDGGTCTEEEMCAP